MQLHRWRRAVLKIGSSLVAPDGVLSTRYRLGIARFIAEARLQNREIILVSSGAVAAGKSVLPSLAENGSKFVSGKQALAAAGQARLIMSWATLFDFPVAQLLLTASDLQDRKRYVNAKNTLRELLNSACLPIINENDSIVTDELKFGDNDNLAAHVASLIDADLLIIGSDIGGLYDENPSQNTNAKKIDCVQEINAAIYHIAGGAGSKVGTGGMYTKIQAAERATKRGITTVIGSGKENDFFSALLDNRCIGTSFVPKGDRKTARKHWLEHHLIPEGKIFIDDGAAKALLERGASLLPSGVKSIEGEFQQGDAIEVLHLRESNAVCIGKGISQFDAAFLQQIKGLRTEAIIPMANGSVSDVVIHRDDLVLI